MRITLGLAFMITALVAACDVETPAVDGDPDLVTVTCNPACSGATPVCNTSNGKCVACMVSSDCIWPYGQVCKTNACTVCTVDSDCGSGKKCVTDADGKKRCYKNTDKCATKAATTTDTTSSDYYWRGIYWGSLHEHTNWSLDAYFKQTSPSTSSTYSPDGAYDFAFALNGASKTQDNATVKIPSALDWVAITDHSEYFDTQQACLYNTNTSATPYTTTYCKNYRDLGASNNGYLRQAELVDSTPDYTCTKNDGNRNVLGVDFACPETRRDPNTNSELECTSDIDGTAPCDSSAQTMWVTSQKLADQYDTNGRNAGCTYATLNAFEYSSNVSRLADGTSSKTANEHRNIIFRGPGKATSGKTTVTPFPLDYISYPTASKLWAALEYYCSSSNCAPGGSCDNTMCRAIAIPHNPNDSDGSKFDVKRDSDGTGLQRSKFEKLVEIHQHKGSSECLNQSATGTDGAVDANTNQTFDPTCEFELGTTTTGETATPTSGSNPSNSPTGLPKRATDWKGYVRAGLATGILAYQAAIDANATAFNPLQLGIIGATDSHNAAPGYTVETNWHGNTGDDDDQVADRLAETNTGAKTTYNTQRYWNSGALTAVHAKRNVREDIWDALNAREAYGTSGDRIKLWFFLLPASDTTQWCDGTHWGADASGGYNTAAQIRKAIVDDAAKNGGKASGAPMGGTVSRIKKTTPATGTPTDGLRFVVIAWKDPRFTGTSKPEDTHNLAEIDLIQTRVIDNKTRTEDLVFRMPITTPGGLANICKIFSVKDTATLAGATQYLGASLSGDTPRPHLWYVRVLETPIWSSRYYDCEASNTNCAAAWPANAANHNLSLCGTVINGKCTYASCATSGKCKDAGQAQCDDTKHCATGIACERQCTDGTVCTDSGCTYNDANTTDAAAVFRNTYVRIRERAWSSPIWFMP